MYGWSFSFTNVVGVNVSKCLYYLAQGEGGVREKISELPSRRKDLPYLACLMGMKEGGTLEDARWVAGGKLDDDIGFRATNVFPVAEKGLFLELRGSLSSFSFPLDSSNFSTYLEVPNQLSVVCYFLSDTGKEKEYVDWDRAVEGGVSEFAVRLVVAPISTREAILQVGAVPFSVKHMRENYGEVFERCFFPNTMVRCTKARTRLPKSMGAGTTLLAKKVEMVMEDSEGLGLGVMPFFVGLDFDPYGQEFDIPSYEMIKEGLFSFMRAGAWPVAKSAAQMPVALEVALKADKDARNVLPPVDSPWPAFNVGGGEGHEDAGQEGRCLLRIIRLDAVQLSRHSGLEPFISYNLEQSSTQDS